MEIITRKQQDTFGVRNLKSIQTRAHRSTKSEVSHVSADVVEGELSKHYAFQNCKYWTLLDLQEKLSVCRILNSHATLGSLHVLKLQLFLPSMVLLELMTQL